MVLSQLSLCGAPYIRGFYSKDIIVVLGGEVVRSGIGSLLLALFGLPFTRFYRIRLIWCGLYSCNYKSDMSSCKRYKPKCISWCKFELDRPVLLKRVEHVIKVGHYPNPDAESSWDR